MGTLYLVPNALDLGTADAAVPIDAVLPRGVLETAAAIGDWVAENAKSARAFLKRVDAVIPLARPLQAIAIVEWPRAAKGPVARSDRPGGRRPAADPATAGIARLLAPALAGRPLGLLSEAGLPALADPGASLVAAAHAAGVRVQALAGPSAIALALAASGLEGQSFAFVGYVPSEAAARAGRLRELEGWSRRSGQTQLMIETPYRNAALLAALVDALAPATWLSVSVGLTLAAGWTRTDRVATWRARPSELPGDVPAVFAFLAKG